MPHRRGNSLVRGSGHSFHGYNKNRDSILKRQSIVSGKKIEEEAAVFDLVLLTTIDEANVIRNISNMYYEDHIYCYIGNVVISMNPFKDLPIYDEATIAKYRGRSAFDPKLAPHIFALADNVFSDMTFRGRDQVVIISGESGAGKTEAAKKVMMYIAAVSKEGPKVNEIKDKLLTTNPLLESFGNAKTTRNDNSSRFGKYMDIQFDFKGNPCGGVITTYLLEKARVTRLADGERNFHIFYQLLAGGRASKFGMKSDPKAYAFLKQGETKARGINDKSWFGECTHGFQAIGFSEEETTSLWQSIAAVLMLGNVTFKSDGKDGSRLADRKAAAACEPLIGTTVDKIEAALTHNTVVAQGDLVAADLNPDKASSSRDTLCKAMYQRLFIWMCKRINQSIAVDPKEIKAVIGVLDIYGFEVFQFNSFEQFCINYCNEKLQQFFNGRVLKDEQELYVKESIKFKEVEFVDNQDCIELIEMPKNGILAMLDEESKLPKSSDNSFCDKLHAAYAKHIRVMIPRKSKMKWYKQLRNDEGFVIRHFAGAVCYEVEGFMDKNNDALTVDLSDLMNTSKDPFLKGIFQHREGDPKPQKGKLAFISLGDKFKKALNVLMEKLNSTRASFIRCIKPNQVMKPKIFAGGEILSQLQCAGMVSVLDLMQGGYPSRTLFQDLYDMYKKVLPPELAALHPRDFAKALFKALGMSEDDFQFGVSRVFFRPGKFAEFDTIMRADPESLVELVAKVQDWLVKAKWKKITWACVASIKFASKIRARAGAAIIMQNVIKMFLQKSVHRHRYVGIRDLRNMTSQIESMRETVDKMPKNKDKMMAQVDGIIKDLKATMDKIKANETISREQIAKLRADMDAKINKQLEAIKKEQKKQQLMAEAERLKKLAEKMEAERKKKLEEEVARKKAEEEAQLRKQMEEQQRKDAEAEAIRLEKERIQAEKDAKNKKLQDKQGEEARRAALEAAAIEQERRDQELAMRLAMDATGGEQALTEEAQAAAASGGAHRRSKAKTETTTFSSKKEEKVHKKHDLSKWKYADLRDTINTSVEVDLLEACREEFHRRLKVYHAWKMKNQNKAQTRAEARAPAELQSAAASRGAAPPPPAKKKKSNARPQRYFRIPFVRPGDKGKANIKKGWWFAHFDGQWIARQMELHPEKAPVLLVAGKDDMEMCELSLEETGLSRKRGAEILPREFEDEWSKCGGTPYNAK
eukprot:m.100093 g.100093  ORF g.100093 m.100093 type:complete len:1206 (+) comp10335_c1_seq1:121-3738(+)